MIALRSLALRHQQFTAEIAALDHLITDARPPTGRARTSPVLNRRAS
jgi:hypothetical protein